jgi:hypothetical protein
MKKRYIEAVKHKIWDYVVTNYSKVDIGDFVLGEMPYNYKCFLNCVQKVKEGKAERVFACVAMERNNWKNIIVHFINQLSDGKYQDNTWGYTYEENDYYIIREINPSEYAKIETIFTSIQETLVKSHSSKFIRKLLGVKIEII